MSVWVPSVRPVELSVVVAVTDDEVPVISEPILFVLSYQNVTPPTEMLSVAAALRFTVLPETTAPEAGRVIDDVGLVVSGVAVVINVLSPEYRALPDGSTETTR